MANKITQRERERERGIPIKNDTKKGYLLAYEHDAIDISTRRKNHRGTVQHGMSQTIKTGIEVGVLEKMRIRRLTPRETWRLMGFSDDEFNKAQKVNTDSQLYKQAGNSIVVNVLEAIFKEML